MKNLPFLFLLIIFLVASCDSNRVFEKNTDIPNNLWIKEEKPHFEFEITDTSIDYNIYYNIRNAVSYPFYNLYLTHYLKDSVGTLISTNLDELTLFNPKTGQPNGKGMGDIFDHRIPMLTKYKFDQPGKYTLEVEQFMRMDELPMIMAVGIRIEQSND